MRRGSGRGDRDDAVVDVEMVDVYVALDGTVHEDGMPVDPEPEEQRTPIWRRPWFLWSVGVLVVVAVAVANVLEVRRDLDRRAAIADHPLAVSDLSEPLEEQWRVAGGWVVALAADLVVVDTMDGLTALDPATGAVRWLLGRDEADQDVLQYCLQVTDQPNRITATPEGGWPDAADLMLACQSSVRAATGVGEVARVEVVRADTGEPLHSIEMPGEPLTIERVDDDLLLVSGAPGSRLQIVRWNPTTGAEEWRYVSDEGVLGQSVDGWTMGRDGDVYTVSAGSTVRVSLTTGTELAPDEDGVGLDESYRSVTELADGRRAVWEFPSSGSGRASAHVEDEDGTVLFELPGPVWRADVHDGSAPEVLLVSDVGGRRLHGVDAGDGRVIWSIEELAAGTSYPVVQVAGVAVITVGGEKTMALDVHDGSVRWSLENRTSVFGTAVTDGARVLVPVPTEDGQAMAAVDVRDGTEEWRVPMPDDAESFMTLPGGHVAVSTIGALVGMG